VTETDATYITPPEAAARLGKSASQVRRDARSQRINSIRKGGRIWIRVDERFEALERDPSLHFPADLDTTGDSNSVTLMGGEYLTKSDYPVQIGEELIDEIADLRAEVARLTARIRKLEARC
jgi:hypothetical protein